MTDISIIIVNYNVKHYLDQCLRSVYDAVHDLKVEIFVVDNDSIDGSVDHIRKNFQEVKLIANKKNVGFAKANNQAIKVAKGKYILLLNPDTIIENDTLTSCFEFMESKPTCGALGVKMIDGEGKFLPESKRGFPSPWASLMRLTGMSRIFPKSKIFNKYNLGFLSENEINEVDVLCGAFMFIRKEALDKVGFLDEDFFMYGEDIDLSFRIQEGGYKIFYYAENTIVHFKGESTKKSSLKYYSTFYNAMAIFAKKHFGGRRINPFLWLINLAILFVGISDFVMKSLGRVVLPVVEFLVFLGTLHLVEYLWASYYFADSHYYDAFNSLPVYFVYSLMWIMSLWMVGSYRSINNRKKLFWGVVGGTLTMLILYALVDNSLRHSRAIIILATAGSLIMSLMIRILYSSLMKMKGKERKEVLGRIIAVGKPDEIRRAREILEAGNGKSKKWIGALYPGEEAPEGEDYLQSLARLSEVIDVYKVDEVFFSAQSVPLKEIMAWMTKLGSRVKIKILSNDVQSIIGSHDRNSRGDLYTLELRYRITIPYNRFLKVMLDYLFSLLMLAVSPVILIVTFNPNILRSIFLVLFRKRTWISYIRDDQNIDALPPLMSGITVPVAHKSIGALSQEEKHSINFFYARDFSLTGEIGILLLNLWHIIRR